MSNKMNGFQIAVSAILRNWIGLFIKSKIVPFYRLAKTEQ